MFPGHLMWTSESYFLEKMLQMGHVVVELDYVRKLMKPVKGLCIQLRKSELSHLLTDGENIDVIYLPKHPYILFRNPSLS